jgi:hypothetical protein
MRHKPKWFIGATIPVAVGSLAAIVAGALPAMAQQTNCHHHAPASTAATTVQAVTTGPAAITARCVPKLKLGTPVRIGGKATIVVESGKTTRAPGGVTPVARVKLTPVAASGKLCAGSVILSTAKAVKAVPVTSGQGGTTGASPS